MFKYNYVADLFDRLVKNASFPMQVELHPGPACAFNCRYCYGKSQRLNEGLLTIEEYSKSLSWFIKSYEISKDKKLIGEIEDIKKRIRDGIN